METNQKVALNDDDQSIVVGKNDDIDRVDDSNEMNGGDEVDINEAESVKNNDSFVALVDDMVAENDAPQVNMNDEIKVDTRAAAICEPDSENNGSQHDEFVSQDEISNTPFENDQDGEVEDDEVEEPRLDDSNATKNNATTKEVKQNDDGPEEGEDLEDGEIDDDDEDEDAKVLALEVTPHSKEAESSRRDHRKSRRSGSRGHEDDEDDGSDGERRSSRHRKHKSERRKDRSKRDLEKELKSDEEKKRLLKEKLRALELQMGHVDVDEGDDVDDEEMGIYVSGGSPLHGRKRMIRSDDSDAGSTGSDSPSAKRKRRGGKQDHHQRSSDRDDEPNIRPRNSRQIEKSAEICPLFMQGKCPKNAQTCHYSHDADPPKIMELCKFYLFERCAKKEKCLYLHKGFPCKYYHTGHRCLDTAETCKFSHEPLTDITRPILLKHLESAPKEILGDFPRFTRENAAALVYKTEAKHKGWDNFDDDMPEHMRHQTRSAADSFIENSNRQQQLHHDQGPYFGGGPDNGERRKRPSRWGDQANANFMGGPGGPMGGPGGPMGGPGGPMGGPAGPMKGPGGPVGGPGGPMGGPRMRMGGPGGPVGSQMGPGGPMGPRQGKGLLGEAPRALMSLPIAPPGTLLPTSSHPSRFDDGNVGEDQIKDFLKAQREALMGAVNVLEKKRGPQQQSQDSFNQAGGSMFGQDSNPFRQDYPMGESSSEPPFKKRKDGNASPTERPSVDVDKKDESESLEILPQTQQRLFERIQQKQRDSTNDEIADVKNGDADGGTPKEDSWYSSDEDKAKTDRPNRKKRWDVQAPLGQDEKPVVEPPTVVVPQISLPKELADVLSSIKKDPIKEKLTEEVEQKAKAPSRDPRMNRDPRFARMQDPKAVEQNPKPAQQQQLPFRQPDPVDEAEKEKDKKILEMDLSIFGTLELPTFKEAEPEDEEEDRMGLPFKPHRVQPVAKEIDASIYSHPVLDYKLRPLELTKPDYSSLVVSIHASRVQQDPRLKRYAKKRPLPLEPSVVAATATAIEPKSSPVSTGSERPSDPRRKNALASTTAQSSPSSTQDLPKQQQHQVYNPKNDLYASKPRQDDYDYPHKGSQQEVYSPSQDVQDMYGSYNRGGRPNDPRNYDPREDMGPNRGHRQNSYEEDWNEHQGVQYGNGNNRNWGPQRGGHANWGGPSHQPQHPDHGYYDELQGDGSGYYPGPDQYDGYGGGPPRGGMMGGPHRGGGQVRSVDPRTQGRDPRRR